MSEEMKGYSVRLAYVASSPAHAELIRREVLDQLGAVTGFDYPGGILELSHPALIVSPTERAEA